MYNYPLILKEFEKKDNYSNLKWIIAELDSEVLDADQ